MLLIHPDHVTWNIVLPTSDSLHVPVTQSSFSSFHSSTLPSLLPFLLSSTILQIPCYPTLVACTTFIWLVCSIFPAFPPLLLACVSVTNIHRLRIHPCIISQHLSTGISALVGHRRLEPELLHLVSSLRPLPSGLALEPRPALPSTPILSRPSSLKFYGTISRYFAE